MSQTMPQTSKRTLIAEDILQERIHTLGDEINRHYKSVDILIVISVLKGSVFFMADLVRKLRMDTELGFLFFSSYQGGTTSQGKVEVFDLPMPDLFERNVLLVEDIFDSGMSLKHAYDLCAAQNPVSLRTCVLLEKQGIKHQADVPRDFVGFRIQNEFVVGYGLDYQEKYRNLPYIAVLEV